MWRISVALEKGEHAEAAALAATDDPADSRRTTFLIEHARALYGLHRPDEEVVSLLMQAEKLGRIRTLTNPFVREIVSTMLARARRESAARNVWAWRLAWDCSKPRKPLLRSALLRLPAGR